MRLKTVLTWLAILSVYCSARGFTGSPSFSVTVNSLGSAAGHWCPGGGEQGGRDPPEEVGLKEQDRAGTSMGTSTWDLRQLSRTMA